MRVSYDIFINKWDTLQNKFKILSVRMILHQISHLGAKKHVLEIGSYDMWHCKVNIAENCYFFVVKSYRGFLYRCVSYNASAE